MRQSATQQEKERTLVGHPKEDTNTRGRQVVLEKLEWSGSLDVRVMSGSSSDNADGSAAIKMCLRQCRRQSP
jgi:hypothetical protein